jgi:hypothetical protein
MSAAWETMDKRVIASAFRGWSRFVIDFLAAIKIVGYEGRDRASGKCSGRHCAIVMIVYVLVQAVQQKNSSDLWVRKCSCS